MIPQKSAIPGLLFGDSQQFDVPLPKGQLLSGLVLSVQYTDTVTVASAAARTYGSPLSEFFIIGDGGKAIINLRPQTALKIAQLYEQAALGSIVNPPTSLATGAQVGTIDLPIMFAEPFADRGLATLLPTWLYDNILFRARWGSHANVYQGGTGALSLGAGQQVQLSGIAAQSDFSKLGDPFVWAKKLSRQLLGYQEVAAPGAVNAQFSIPLPRTADYRSLIIETEDANGQPTDNIINTITLLVDNTVRQFNVVPYTSQRAENAKVFGVQAMPTGLVILEFAEDRDITHLLQARRMTDLQLVLDVKATAGTIRVSHNRIEAFS